MDEFFDDDEVETANKFELIVTDEFEEAIRIAETTQDHMFITGDAGTGKSTWLKHFLRTTRKKVAVLAPTGIAAVNVGGQTIHSFFKWPPRPMTSADIKYLEDGIYGALDAIVIDEISMVRVDQIDLMDEFLQMNRQNSKPFGGCQMILIGDLLQLPPVTKEDMTELKLFERYGCEYFFAADVWKEANLTNIKFTKIFRQQDPVFIDMLNRIRKEQMTYADMDWFNERKYTPEIEENSAFLCSLNRKVDEINSKRIAELEGEEYSYDMVNYGRPSFIKQVSKYIPETLVLKNGAKVMMLMNDPNGAFMNGTIGHVSMCGEHQILVNIYGRDIWVKRHKWDSVKHRLKGDRIETISDGHIEQFPMKLAYAISIHKSQGQTFDSVIIDFGNGTFASGMAYVAISRCKTREGVFFNTPLRKSDVYFDKKVIKFLELGRYER